MAFGRWLDAVKRQASPDGRRLGAAGLLGIGTACFNHWRRRWRNGRRGIEARGRPAAKAPGDVIDKVAEIFGHLGPAASAATLMGLCPELGRNEAERLLADMRRQCREDHRASVNALQWLRPGAVWAMDHTRPPGAVDGLYPYVLLVRDLASHFQVAAIPQSAATDLAMADALTDLFVRHGAPLVLKSDNHGAFTGRAVRRVLEQWGVLSLTSPPYLPRYNGAVEAGAGQCKTRTHVLAARMNRPGRWTADDVEGARIQANRSLRPWGPAGPTPEQRWKDRREATTLERDNLLRDYGARLAEHNRNPPARENEGGAVFRVERSAPVEMAAAIPPADNRREAPSDDPGEAPPGDHGQTMANNPNSAPALPGAATGLPFWARIWNASPSPGYRRPGDRSGTAVPGQTDAGSPEAAGKASVEGVNEVRKAADSEKKITGQPRNDAVYYQKLIRRSLTDALVAARLLIIRKRLIPLPIKRLMRLKFS